MKGLLVIISAVVMFCGCASHLVPINTKSYQTGASIETSVGSPMISVEDQEVVNGSRWVGIAFSPTGYEQHISKFKKELIYGGKTGDTVNITYREYRDDYARAPFFQDLKYDLKESKEIRFQHFRILIESATNSSIRFIVLSD